MTRTIQINDHLRFEINIYSDNCFFHIQRLNSYMDDDGNTKEYWGDLIVSAKSAEELMTIGEYIVKAAQLMVLA